MNVLSLITQIYEMVQAKQPDRMKYSGLGQFLSLIGTKKFGNKRVSIDMSGDTRQKIASLSRQVGQAVQKIASAKPMLNFEK